MDVGKPTSKPGGDASAPVASSAPADGLGEFGPWLSRHHVGDLTGILGLVLSVFTFIAAVQAKKAARAALARRDVLEIATLFAELAERIRDIRNVLGGTDWSPLSDRIDSAVAISNRVASTTILADEVLIVDEARTTLRSLQIATSSIRDSTKHQRLRARQDKLLIKLVDGVQVAHGKRVKNVGS